jgi:S1-C subfamily serine protease
MDETLLFESVERYLSGQMSPQERAFFEEMRQKSAELDQLVVEHTHFLAGLEQYGQTKNFRHLLGEVESKLTDEGILITGKDTVRGKLVYFWTRYRRNIAVAATIAGFISLITSGLLISYNKKYGNENYVELVNRINKTNREVEILKKNKTTTAPAKPEPQVDYRATGFLLSNKGFLVTNAHVAGKMKNIYVENGKGEYFTARVLCTDNATDLALLQITDSSFKCSSPMPYAIRRNNADLGDQFFTLGYPRNEIVYGEGYLSAKSGNEGDSLAYQLTVSANPGNSGAPVINRSGEIIGIITGKDAKADGVVYAAKSKYIYRLVEQYKKENPEAVLKLNSTGDLRKMDRSRQIKIMEDLVYMVVGN